MGKKRVKKIEGRGGVTPPVRSSKTQGRKSKKRIKRRLTKGQAHIQSTYNNTIVTLTDIEGNVIAWSSAGTIGFRGTKKATPFAASLVVKNVVGKVARTGLKEVDVFVKGIGSGRESAIRALAANGLEVLSISDVTPIPHGGCRPPKPRRV